MMKKIFLLLLILSTVIAGNAQTEKETAKPPKKFDLSKRTADHFMIQYGLDNWLGKPDSIVTKGFSRHFNVYVMLDKPFKNNPKFSVGVGVGISSSNMFFDKRYINVKSTSTLLPFNRSYSGTDSSYFNKFKLVTVFLEAPIELRYYANPENPNASWKGAIGIKVGTLLNAHTKGKTLQNSAGNTINKITEKENSKSYFNATRISLTGRVGYGIYSLFGAYSVTNIFKDGVTPDTKLLQIGIAISGL